MGVKIQMPDEWLSMFTTKDSRCSTPWGTRVRKNRFDMGDMHPEGMEGTVIGTSYHPDLKEEVWLVQMDGDNENTRAITLPYKFDLI